MSSGKAAPSTGAVIRHSGNRVQISSDGEFLFDGEWRAADALTAAMKLGFGTWTLGFATVVHEGDERVKIIFNGKAVLDLEASAAAGLRAAITAQARKAEEHEKAESIAMDQAILTRAGAPFGITSEPKIQEEAAKIAAWDSVLRRRMPGGVKSSVMHGTPVIIVHPPEGQR